MKNLFKNQPISEFTNVDLDNFPNLIDIIKQNLNIDISENPIIETTKSNLNINITNKTKISTIENIFHIYKANLGDINIIIMEDPEADEDIIFINPK